MGEKAPVPSGAGKSHLAQALGHCAVRAIGAFERKLAHVPLLIVDDFGLKPMRPPTDEHFHDLIAERYEQAAPSSRPTSTSPSGIKHFRPTARPNRLPTGPEI